ncbi:unnamed protein product [Amoebophrya sp. A120]|nr:unnamed protein product [Amoebophrya sp. A120]|eukprot:GSA120T00021800001.1
MLPCFSRSQGHRVTRVTRADPATFFLVSCWSWVVWWQAELLQSVSLHFYRQSPGDCRVCVSMIGIQGSLGPGAKACLSPRALPGFCQPDRPPADSQAGAPARAVLALLGCKCRRRRCSGF